MKKIIGFSILAVLLCAGVSYADVAPGAQQAGGSLFEQMDQDGDGVVTDTEFEEYRTRAGDETMLFSTIDQNADGSISQSEWQAYESGAGQRQMGAEEQPMSSEEMKDDGDTPAEERAYGPGVENKQRENLAKQMGEEPKQ